MIESSEPVTPPAMVRPPQDAFGDLPIRSGKRCTLGIKVRGRGDAFYFLASARSLRRYARRFPMTEQGWAAAWSAFATEDPDAARGYLAGPSPRPRAQQLPAQDADPVATCIAIGALLIVAAIVVLLVGSTVTAVAIALMLGAGGLLVGVIGGAMLGVRLELRRRQPPPS